MQMSYFIPSLYSLGKEGDSNNSKSRQLHKSLKNPCNSNVISGMPRITQRLIICSAFGSRHRHCHCLLPCLLVADVPGNSHSAPSKEQSGFFYLLWGRLFFKRHAMSLGTNLTFSTTASQSQAWNTTYKHSQFLHPQQPFQQSPQRTPSNTDRSEVRLK